jgi:hypothetical protein
MNSGPLLVVNNDNILECFVINAIIMFNWIVFNEYLFLPNIFHDFAWSGCIQKLLNYKFLKCFKLSPNNRKI